MFSKLLPSLRRIAAAVNARRWAIGCACVLVVAGALRFYGLGANSLWHDEAVAAVIARGALADVVVNAGVSYSNTSPVLHPIALWAVQKVSSSEFSLRLIPAAASLLTVGALLFWMPRLGVARRAAFMAALLAALSVAAIDHARDAREYSVDALVAVAIIGGFLQYMRDGRKAALCVALFVGPLLQYGLVVFGVGALAAAALAPAGVSQMLGLRRALTTTLWERLRARVDLLLPAACFAGGCALTWWLTGRHQGAEGGWGSGGYLADFYYEVGYGSSPIGFAFGRTWDMLGYHMPPAIAAVAVVAFVALLSGTLKRDRFDAIAILALTCFTVWMAVWGGLTGSYPFGGSRHNLYLGPIVFLAAGGAFHWAIAAVTAEAGARRAWTATALGAVVVAAIAVLGARAVWGADTYYAKDGSMGRALAALDERKRDGDAVFVSRYEVPAVEFYKGGRPADYFYGKAACWGDAWGAESWAECVPEILDEMFRMVNNSSRVWLVHNSSVSVPEEVGAYAAETGYWRDVDVDVDVEEVVGGGWTTLHLVTGFEELAADIRREWLDLRAEIESDAPAAVSEYNLYLKDNALYYEKQPCAAGDTDARFFLHIYPTAVSELPAWRLQYGFDNLDFDFYDYGLRVDDRCMIWRGGLPEYAVERIHTGQFVPPRGPRLWEVEVMGER